MVDSVSQGTMLQRGGLLENSNPFVQLLVLIGMSLLGWVIFTFLSIGCAYAIFHVPDFETLKSILGTHPEALLLNTNYLNAIKFMQLLSQLGIIGIPAIVFGLLMGRKKDYLHIDKGLPFVYLFLGVLLTLVINPCIGWLGDLNERLWLPHFLKPLEDWMKSSEETNDKLTHVFTQMRTINDLFINLIIIGFVAGICEELFFRGCLQNIILKSTRNPHVAIWVSAFVFSAIHLQFYGFVPRLVLGGLLGYTYYYTGRLWVNAWIHSFFNGIQVLLLYLYQHHLIKFNIDDTTETPSFWMAMLSVVITVLVVLWIRQQSLRNRTFIGSGA